MPVIGPRAASCAACGWSGALIAGDEVNGHDWDCPECGQPARPIDRKPTYVELARVWAADASRSAKSAVDTAGEYAVSKADAVKTVLEEHAPTTEQLRSAAERAKDAVQGLGVQALELGRDVWESKAGKDAAKGALVGGVVAVPIPVVGPMFGALVGAVVAVYFGQKGAAPDDTVHVPAEGSEMYRRLRELDDLRRRKIISRADFETQVRAILDATAPQATRSPAPPPTGDS